MREIKFRAWNKFKKEMFDPMPIIDFKIYEINAVELMQLTGLQDKSGKDIYEGDICEGHSDGNGIITWTDFDGGYDYVFDDGANVGIYEVKKDIRVIGNIYENPELL